MFLVPKLQQESMQRVKVLICALLVFRKNVSGHEREDK